MYAVYPATVHKGIWITNNKKNMRKSSKLAKLSILVLCCFSQEGSKFIKATIMTRHWPPH